jgi:hypothetical protein
MTLCEIRCKTEQKKDAGVLHVLPAIFQILTLSDAFRRNVQKLRTFMLQKDELRDYRVL